MLFSPDEKSLHLNTAFDINWFLSSANRGNRSRYSPPCRAAVRANPSDEARGMFDVFCVCQFSWVLVIWDIFIPASHFEVQDDFLLLGMGIFLFLWSVFLVLELPAQDSGEWRKCS